MSTLAYEDRIVLFLDVLGWKELIVSVKTIDWLHELLDDAPHLAEGVDSIRSQGKVVPFGIEAAYFSDSIVFSLRHEQKALSIIFDTARHISNHFLKHRPWLGGGLLCRGTILRGELHHHGNIVFGPALNAAVEREKNVANFPRILVDDALVRALGAAAPAMHVREDSDGLFYLDVLAMELIGADDWNRTVLQEFRQSIEKGLKAHISHERHGIKWKWLANRFNEVTARFAHLGVQSINL